MEFSVDVLDAPPVEQLGVLVLDGSGAMAEAGPNAIAMGEEVNLAVQDLLARLKASRFKESLYLAIITFDTSVALKVPPTRVIHLDQRGDYNPLHGHGGGAAIGEALDVAGRLAKDFIDVRNAARADRHASANIVLLTKGGWHTAGPDPAAVVSRIRKGRHSIRICCAVGREVADLERLELRRLVADPLDVVQGYDSDDLLRLFECELGEGEG